jgi:hypothetical protein
MNFFSPSANAHCYFRFRFALSCAYTISRKEKGRTSGKLIRPLSTSETQPDSSAFSCATRFTTAGVLLSTTTNHERQAGREKHDYFTSRSLASRKTCETQKRQSRTVDLLQVTLHKRLGSQRNKSLVNRHRAGNLLPALCRHPS